MVTYKYKRSKESRKNTDVMVKYESLFITVEARQTNIIYRIDDFCEKTLFI